MNIYYFGSALNLSSIYMIAGAGAAISLKSGKLNLGGEGQIYCGGFVCAVLLNFFSQFIQVQNGQFNFFIPLFVLISLFRPKAFPNLEKKEAFFSSGNLTFFNLSI